jgi:5-methylcytosine-specific restriction endonuclease McrA
MRKVRYRRATIVVPDAPPLTGICECCGNKRKTDTHHVVYLFKTSEVRKNPKLALENTVQLCFPCHRVADAMRIVLQADYAVTLKLNNLKFNVLGHTTSGQKIVK